MFGGSSNSLAGSWAKQSKLADTTLLQFCEYMNMLIPRALLSYMIVHVCVMLLSSDKWSYLSLSL